MNPFRFEKPVIQPLFHPAVQPENKEVNVLRLDQLDPLLSGNKWFKLTLYLQEALDLNKKRVVTFGGAWSNQ
jgi:1-aminocyclopropane-1-carboxylate deaminase